MDKNMRNLCGNEAYAYCFNPKRILCAVDLSELSSLALKYAAVAAQGYDASLTVFHAERFELPPYFTSTQIAQLTRELQSERREAQDYLCEYAQKVLGRSAEHLKLTYMVAEAHPVDAILNTAREQKADLLVMGTHGRGGAKRLWLGSVAENVVRQAEVPVFIVRQKEHDFIDPNRPEASPALKNILCPVSFSPAACACMQAANSIAQRFGACLMPVHITERGERDIPAEEQKRLESWAKTLLTSPCKLEFITTNQRVAEEIVALAQQRKADLIALGTEQSHPFRARLMGTTTELVLRGTPVPVLVLPLPVEMKGPGPMLAQRQK